MNNATVYNGAIAGADTGHVSLLGNGAWVMGGDDEDGVCPRGHCGGGKPGDDGGDVTVGGNNGVYTGNAWSTARAWTLVNLNLDF